MIKYLSTGQNILNRSIKLFFIHQLINSSGKEAAVVWSKILYVFWF